MARITLLYSLEIKRKVRTLSRSLPRNFEVTGGVLSYFGKAWLSWERQRAMDGWYSSKHWHFPGPLTLCMTMPYSFHSHCVCARVWALFFLSFSLWPWSQRQWDRPQIMKGFPPPRSSYLLSFLFSLFSFIPSPLSSPLLLSPFFLTKAITHQGWFLWMKLA